jgi:hypothetical protein
LGEPVHAQKVGRSQDNENDEGDNLDTFRRITFREMLREISILKEVFFILL